MFACAAGLLAPCDATLDIDFGSWDRLMSKHVRRGSQLGIPINIVDYPAIVADRDFATFIEALADVDPSHATAAESHALGINMYNAFAIETLIDYACKYENNLEQSGECLGPAYGLPDVQFSDKNSSFTLPYHRFAGGRYSLNDIEGMMRPIPKSPLFNSPFPGEDLRTHATLVCDGTSCPDLLNAAYMPATLDAQMDAAVTGWMANPWKGMRIDRQNNTVYWSKIMSWFGNEFEAQGGIIKAYSRFFTPEATAYFASEKSYSTGFLGYVWDANGPIPCDCMPKSDTRIPLPDCHIR